jgi:hypothetical protein
MNFTDGLLHALNFIAPALWMALMLVLAEKLFARKRPLAWGIRARLALYALLGLAALVGGLVFFGRDAKTATYAALVALPTLASLTLQKFWKA